MPTRPVWPHEQTRAMRLAAYHPWIYLKSGLERHFFEVLRRSRHEWTLYTSHYRRDDTFDIALDLEVVELSPHANPPGGLVNGARAAAAVARTKVPVDRHDGLLVGLNGISDLALGRASGPIVGLCFTPVKAMHDPKVVAALRAENPRKYWAARAVAPFFNPVDRYLWRRLDRVVANSYETRDRIARAGLWAAGDVRVIQPGVDTDWFRPANGARAAQVLAAGRISWHKNLELAIDTVRILNRDQPEVTLVIAGDVAAADEAYYADLRRYAAGASVEFVQRPDDRKLLELYQRSEALLFTARNEDFGLVPLEAMACGTPVISVDAGGPRETITDGEGGWLLPPEPESFARQLASLLSEGDRTRHRKAARQRAERFDWGQVAARMDDVMEEAVQSRGRAG